jgi:hypothetical protein
MRRPDALESFYFFVAAVVAISATVFSVYWWGENHPELLPKAPIYTQR